LALKKVAGQLRDAAEVRKNSIKLNKNYVLQLNSDECYCRIVPINKPGSGMAMSTTFIRFSQTQVLMEASYEKFFLGKSVGIERLVQARFDRKKVMKYDGFHDDSITTGEVCEILDQHYSPNSSEVDGCWTKE
jgi:hypothetical protein